MSKGSDTQVDYCGLAPQAICERFTASMDYDLAPASSAGDYSHYWQ